MLAIMEINPPLSIDIGPMSTHNSHSNPRITTGLYPLATSTIQDVSVFEPRPQRVIESALRIGSALQIPRRVQRRKDFSMEEIMASGTYFFRSCPTCGRHLNVRIELLGRDVECAQCHATFVANEEPEVSPDDQRIEQILARAQRYIDSVQPFNTATAEEF